MFEADNLAKRGRRSDQLIDQLEDPEIQASLKMRMSFTLQ